MILNNISEFIDILNNSIDLTFLVGAGCSIESPSNLPGGTQMMEEIIKYSCCESEINTLIEVIRKNEIRFESLIEIIQHNYDRNLKTLEFYSQCQYPNKTHFFLANMITRGNQVMTTNFDNLIELALKNILNEEGAIKPIIKKDDFNRAINENNIFNDNLYLIYKLHGSINNCITQEDTRNSIIATISSLGKNNQYNDNFILPDYKKSIFDKLINNRTLIVLGYSGSDDFDIIPSLLETEEIQRIIWIDHENLSVQDAVLKGFMDINSSGISDTLDEFLLKIQLNHESAKIYRLKVDTSKLLDHIDISYNGISEISFNLTPNEWFETQISLIEIYKKIFITLKLFTILNNNEKEIVLSKKLISEACKMLDLEILYQAYNSLGLSYINFGKYKKAKIYYKRNYKVLSSVNMPPYILAKTHSGLGLIYTKSGKYEKACQKFNDALEILDANNMEENKSIILNNLAYVLDELGDVDASKEKLEEGLQIDRQTGNIEGRISKLINFAKIYTDKQRFSDAHHFLQDALNISKGTKNIRQIIQVYNDIGNVYFNSEDLYNSGKNYLRAEDLLSKTNYIEGEYEVYHNFACYFDKIGDPLCCYFASQFSNEALKKLGLNNRSKIERSERELTMLRRTLDQIGLDFII